LGDISDSTVELFSTNNELDNISSSDINLFGLASESSETGESDFVTQVSGSSFMVEVDFSVLFSESRGLNINKSTSRTSDRSNTLKGGNNSHRIKSFGGSRRPIVKEDFNVS